MFKIGDVDIQLVNESVTLVDAGGPFGLVPRALWSRYMQPDPLHNNLLPMWQNCLLVRVAGKIAVVDTGYGTKHDTLNKRILKLQRPRGTLMEGLARAGESITPPPATDRDPISAASTAPPSFTTAKNRSASRAPRNADWKRRSVSPGRL